MGEGDGEKNSKKRLKLGMKLQKLVAKRPFQRPSVLLTSFMRNIQRKRKGILERTSMWPSRFILRSFTDTLFFSFSFSLGNKRKNTSPRSQRSSLLGRLGRESVTSLSSKIH